MPFNHNALNLTFLSSGTSALFPVSRFSQETQSSLIFIMECCDIIIFSYWNEFSLCSAILNKSH